MVGKCFSEAKLLSVDLLKPTSNLNLEAFFSKLQSPLHPSFILTYGFEPLQGILNIRRIAITMFRNALRQSGRTVGAFSASGRVAAVSSK